jgi:hypothetical protein
MRNYRGHRAIALAASGLVALTACGGGDDTTSEENSAEQVNVYGADGNINNSLGKGLPPNSLVGMKGTVAMAELGQDFRDRLLSVDPELENYNTAGETYDAVVITALAAQLAGSNEATTFAPYVNGVTFGGETCTDFASCAEVVEAGGNPDYDGQAGPLGFTEAGEPSQSSYAIQGFASDNTIDEESIEYRLVGEPEDAATDEGPEPAAPNTTGDPLVIGSLTPQTGSLAFQGPQQMAALQLAVDDVNAAGGVLGHPVELVPGDSGDASTDIATQTADRLLGEGVNAIVGASSSGVSLTVIDKITGAGVMMISPASTSDELTDYPDEGLFFRTVAPDTLQARALADLIGGDGNNSLGILVLNDPYGIGLSENTRRFLVEDGLAEENLVEVSYDPNAANFDAEVQQMVEMDPEAILVIGFDESSRIIEVLNEQGIGPQRSE